MGKRIVSLALGMCVIFTMLWAMVFSAGATGSNTGWQVCFDGYKGDDFGGMFEVNSSTQTRVFRQENCAAGIKLNDVLNSRVTKDPQWGDLVFEGWLMYEEEGIEQHGPFHLKSEELYTTQQVMEHTVPDYNVRYVAKWAQIPMPYYESLYRPYFVIGEEGGYIEGFGSVTADGHVVGITDSAHLAAADEIEAADMTVEAIPNDTVASDSNANTPMQEQSVPVEEKQEEPAAPEKKLQWLWPIAVLGLVAGICVVIRKTLKK